MTERWLNGFAGVARPERSPELELGARLNDAKLANLAEYNDTDPVLLPTKATSLDRA